MYRDIIYQSRIQKPGCNDDVVSWQILNANVSGAQPLNVAGIQREKNIREGSYTATALLPASNGNPPQASLGEKGQEEADAFSFTHPGNAVSWDLVDSE